MKCILTILATAAFAAALRAPVRAPVRAETRTTFERLLTASELVDDRGAVWLTADDLHTALKDMHLHKDVCVPEGVVHPSTFLPPHLYGDEPLDVTHFVCTELPSVLEAHPAFAFMADETLGNENFHESVYFGIEPRDEHSLPFGALCRRFVASIVLFEALLALDQDEHRVVARWYETLYTRATEQQREHPDSRSNRPRSTRDALMGFFLALKGESVLASINSFEELRRLRREGRAKGAALAELSDTLNDIMRLNICEAVISNLSFAYWPDNARAGMALLLTPLGRFAPDLTQQADAEWTRLYLAWNANFIWPSHYCPDMMCFTMLAMPSIALGDPEVFQYNRAHTLFWVVRSSQLTRMLSTDERAARAATFGVAPEELRKPTSEQQVPCFHCRQLQPVHDRQPLTSRTARLTRAEGEKLAREYGEDVSEGSGVWQRLAFKVVPQQFMSLARIYRRMPKVSPTKLRLL